MLEFIFKIWYFVAILPVLIFFEANKRLIAFLKGKGIFWDIWHSLLVLLIVLLALLYFLGYR